MNERDMQRMGIKNKDVVNLQSNYDGIIRIAPNFIVVQYDIPSQNLACYFPEANVLIPIDRYARESQTPISKSVKVRIISKSVTFS